MSREELSQEDNIGGSPTGSGQTVGKTASKVTCAMSIVEISTKELAADSDTLLVSRDFVNRAMFKKATQFLKEGGYIIISTKGTRILEPYNTLRGLKRALMDRYPGAKCLVPLPSLTPQFYEKKQSHKTRRNAIQLREKADGSFAGPEMSRISEVESMLPTDSSVVLWGKPINVGEDALVFAEGYSPMML